MPRANRVQWWVNAGPDNAHWMLRCMQYASLRQAKAEVQALAKANPTWVWAIIRGEDLPYEPGSRTMHSASSPITATYIRAWLYGLPGNNK